MLRYQACLKSSYFCRLGTLLLSLCIPTASFATEPPTQAAPPDAKSSSVEERLRSQDELIRRLAEQNAELSRQLGAITQRLDAISTTPNAGPQAGVQKGEEKPTQTGSGLEPTPSQPKVNDSGPNASPDGRPRSNELVDSLHGDDHYGLKSLFDTLHLAGQKGKPWYEKLSFRGYTQARFGRTLYDWGAGPNLLGDSSINGQAEDFSIRRARLILSGDVSDYLSLYFQSDFSATPPDSSNATFFAQLRDLYADAYIDTEKVHRFRIGQSKIPFGFDNMQSSGNRVPIDRTESMDTGVFPNQRDLGVFYYWTPVEKQVLLRELVEGGLKGSGNYGIFALGVYNGQGGGLLERNLSPHLVSRFTWPFQLANGQAIEVSIQGYTGRYVVTGEPISVLGNGPLVVPAGTDGNRGILDQRIAGTFVYYPQPIGFQAEWNVGRGPGLNGSQTAVENRSVSGGYVMAMYKLDTSRHGIFTPYARYQNYHGGYRAIANSPYGTHSEWSLGMEWQIRKEMELTTEYGFVDGVNFDAIPEPGVRSYQRFHAGILRMQFQFNY